MYWKHACQIVHCCFPPLFFALWQSPMDGMRIFSLILTDINECLNSNGGCEQNCSNTLGSFECSCSSYFVLGANGKSCLGKHSILLQDYINNLTIYIVDWKLSYSLCHPFSNTLADFDECSNNTHNCDLNATCNNTYGNFSCICSTGYEGSGIVGDCLGK